LVAATMTVAVEPGRHSERIQEQQPFDSTETVMTTTSTLSGRDRAILCAVAAGGAELQLGTESDLFLDGLCCCDQAAAHQLVRAGLIAPATLGLVGQRVAAALTPAGHRALGSTPLVA
jgi:hypothetical protein